MSPVRHPLRDVESHAYGNDAQSVQLLRHCSARYSGPRSQSLPVPLSQRGLQAKIPCLQSPHQAGRYYRSAPSSESAHVPDWLVPDPELHGTLVSHIPLQMESLHLRSCRKYNHLFHLYLLLFILTTYTLPFLIKHGIVLLLDLVSTFFVVYTLYTLVQGSFPIGKSSVHLMYILHHSALVVKFV